MIEQEKQLLLADLCARLPYNVKISVDDDNLFIPRLKYIEGLACHFWECGWTKYIDEIKPYLRPMSSMTEEEKIEYHKAIVESQNCSFENSESATTMLNDWLLSKHFDVRGLIFKGLALEAQEGMYNLKL